MAWFDDFVQGYNAARTETGKQAGRQEPAAPEPVANGAAENETLAETAELAEKLNARVYELETELAGTAVFGEVLLLPGVKRWLAGRFHPDKPGLNDGERKAFTEAMQKINSAYDALEKKGAQEP
jgi:hypothetical protein